VARAEPLIQGMRGQRAAVPAISVVVNWSEGLKAKLPTK
jgi:hypothetical protein